MYMKACTVWPRFINEHKQFNELLVNDSKVKTIDVTKCTQINKNNLIKKKYLKFL